MTTPKELRKLVAMAICFGRGRNLKKLVYPLFEEQEAAVILYFLETKGYVLVPLEPTEAMIADGAGAFGGKKLRERNAKIVMERFAGKTLRRIATENNMSHENVRRVTLFKAAKAECVYRGMVQAIHGDFCHVGK